MRLFALGMALAAVLASALAGCSSGNSGPATDGPLSGGPFPGMSGGADCLINPVGHPVTFGDERFTNHGHTTVVLDRVSLLRPRGLRMLGSYAVPGVWVVGTQRGWPPRFFKGSRPPTWDSRRPVSGFRVAPGRQFNMVLGVVAVSTPLASAPGMVIYYRDHSGRYLAADHFAMIIAENNRQCEKALPR
jgi:hypothetical protein